jgi:Fe-S-cluster containining protein
MARKRKKKGADSGAVADAAAAVDWSAAPDEPIGHWQRQQARKGSAMARQLKKLRGQDSKALDAQAAAAHEEAFRRIDCLDCGNCCSTIPPIVNAADAKRLARFLRMPEGEFHECYLTRDEDGDTVMNASPCPFLAEDKHCLVYEVRPKACRAYPHTDEAFSKHLDLHARNLPVCPATWFVVEQMLRMSGKLP